MQKEKESRYYNILLSEKERLEAEMKNFEDEMRLNQQESTSELSSYDNHPGDSGSETFEREKDLGLRDNTFTLLKQVDDALEKLNSGNYGICQRCGKKISKERLDIVPHTSFCKTCKEEEENLVSARERPLEEGSFYPPFRGINDDSDLLGYDAEDTWQDVTQYGTSIEAGANPDSVTGEKPQEEAYIEQDEIIGSVGIEDSLIDDELDDLYDTAKRKTTFTGIKGDNKR